MSSGWLSRPSHMTATQPRKIFINLPVRNLQASLAFFRTLGFEFNPRFTDEQAACMIINGDAYVMLLSEAYFSTFTKKQLCNTQTHTEGLFALSCSRRDDVKVFVEKAFAAGATPAMDPVDHGFMVGWSFYDLDGHHWEVIWMDESAVNG